MKTGLSTAKDKMILFNAINYNLTLSDIYAQVDVSSESLFSSVRHFLGINKALTG
jgi:hypothetical protein